jgi:hypothetical protein
VSHANSDFAGRISTELSGCLEFGNGEERSFAMTKHMLAKRGKARRLQ